jgi:hypothetical protein
MKHTTIDAHGHSRKESDCLHDFYARERGFAVQAGASELGDDVDGGARAYVDGRLRSGSFAIKSASSRARIMHTFEQFCMHAFPQSPYAKYLGDLKSSKPDIHFQIPHTDHVAAYLLVLGEDFGELTGLAEELLRADPDRTRRAEVQQILGQGLHPRSCMTYFDMVQSCVKSHAPETLVRPRAIGSPCVPSDRARMFLTDALSLPSPAALPRPLAQAPVNLRTNKVNLILKKYRTTASDTSQSFDVASDVPALFHACATMPYWNGERRIKGRVPPSAPPPAHPPPNTPTHPYRAAASFLRRKPRSAVRAMSLCHCTCHLHSMGDVRVCLCGHGASERRHHI